MMYLQPIQNSDGSYPAPQSSPFKDAIPLTDEQAQMVVDYNGFVTVTSHEETIVDDFTKIVYEVTPNLEAWEAWKAAEAAKPEPEPTAEETTLELLADHEERLCMIELATM